MPYVTKILLLVLCLAFVLPGTAWCACRHAAAQSTATQSCCGAEAEGQRPGLPAHDEDSCNCPAMRAKLFVEGPVALDAGSREFSALLTVESGLATVHGGVVAIMAAGADPPDPSARPLFILHRALLQ